MFFGFVKQAGFAITLVEQVFRLFSRGPFDDTFLHVEKGYRVAPTPGPAIRGVPAQCGYEGYQHKSRLATLVNCPIDSCDFSLMCTSDSNPRFQILSFAHSVEALHRFCF